MIEEFYRSSPGNYLIFLFHMATYNFARDYVQGKHVLDYGCGSGYGTHHLASCCADIVGVDIAGDAIEYAQAHYQSGNLTYVHIKPADQAPLPYADASFDTVLSFQVIEHIRDTGSYLSEIRRVLKPGGIFVCATPDRITRLWPGQKPWNMWHVHEYDAAGFESALAEYFRDIALQRMGGRRGVLEPEIRRTRWLRWVTLPVTLPFMPDAVRVAALKFLKRLAALRGKESALPLCEFPFQESDLVIAPDAEPSVNLIAVACKP
ncbi:MAG: class I SAM-dependent methyltransferase [Nitrosomonadales bacterium]|nr:class I SAM-dependent methyltransferase [Nitrosomonadales bacterium]